MTSLDVTQNEAVSGQVTGHRRNWGPNFMP